MVTSRRVRTALAGVVLLAAVAGADEPPFTWEFTPTEPTTRNQALPAPPPGLPVQLLLDDNVAEGTFGVLSGVNAKQFLWFNRFTNPVPAELVEIWVLFPVGTPLAASIQLAVFRDSDGDPTNGALLLGSYNETVQVADGATFSVYTLPAPLDVGSGDILIGVVPRFIQSGVTPPTQPAALDTNSSQGRSWLAVYTADPPDPPALPGDVSTALVDSFVPGNWMIRGFGQPLPISAIPATGDLGLAAFGLILAGAGFLAVGRRLG